MLCDSTWRSCHEHWSSPWFGAAAPSRHITGYLSHQRLGLKKPLSALSLLAWIRQQTFLPSATPGCKRCLVAALANAQFRSLFCQRLCRNVAQTKSASCACNHVISGRTWPPFMKTVRTSVFPACLSQDQVRGIELVKPGYDDHPSFGLIQSVRQSTHGAIEI